MFENGKKYHKQIALVISTFLFLLALGYTCVFSLSKTLTIKVNNRLTAGSKSQVEQITNAGLNKTLRQVLEENSYPTDDSYVYDVNLDTKIKNINEVTIDKKVNGNIEVDGNVIEYTSGAQNINDLLSELGIKMSTIDYTEPPVETELTQDINKIVIHRQNQKREQREEAIAYTVDQTYDSNLEEGEVEVDIPGIEGKQLVTEDVKYQDGKPIERNLVTQEVLLQPVTQVVRIGTKSESSAGSYLPYSSTNSLNPVSSILSNLSYNGTELNQEAFDLVCAIVEHEGGSNYTGALAVMSCVMNRVDSPNYPDDPVSVLTAPGQFASYLDGYYLQFLGKSSVEVRQAVKDCLNGKRSHNYLNFRSYRTENSVNIGGNWFFND